MEKTQNEITDFKKKIDITITKQRKRVTTPGNGRIKSLLLGFYKFSGNYFSPLFALRENVNLDAEAEEISSHRKLKPS